MSIATVMSSDRFEALEGQGARPSLWLERLTLQDFRNFRQAELDCDGRIVVLTGENGAGKTNILEAVSLLAPGRGLRGARLGELERYGSSNRMPADHLSGDLGAGLGAWAISARVMTPEGPRQIGTGRDVAALERGRDRRVVRLDGEAAKGQQALGEVLAAVWLTPKMDRLLEEGPSARRRFLDRLVFGFDPAHAGRIAAYEQALRERARLLKTGSGEVPWLDSLEQTMAERSVAIAAARRETVGRLAGACAEASDAFPRAGLGLAGDAETGLADAPAVEVEAGLRRRLAADRARDGETGGAQVGAHRCDLTVTHLPRDLPASLCSSGEQKALMLSIVLAHARLVALDRGAPPLILLDEVAAHLDSTRRQALFGALLEIGAQAWMSGTDLANFEALGAGAQHFKVDDGFVRREAL
jgi:DNA replication and repair protein RecF